MRLSQQLLIQNQREFQDFTDCKPHYINHLIFNLLIKTKRQNDELCGGFSHRLTRWVFECQLPKPQTCQQHTYLKHLSLTRMLPWVNFYLLFQTLIRFQTSKFIQVSIGFEWRDCQTCCLYVMYFHACILLTISYYLNKLWCLIFERAILYFMLIHSRSVYVLSQSKKMKLNDFEK